MKPGIERHNLQSRYDVANINEDEWHAYSGEKTAEYLTHYLSSSKIEASWLLNAGAGVYEIKSTIGKEVVVDLFTTPIHKRKFAVCADIEKLPFKSDTFQVVVCVGEVLAYCDPANVIGEFSRVLAKSGILIFDFGSSKSIRYWFRKSYARAADLVKDFYNGKPEKTWIYNPTYIDSLLQLNNLRILDRLGTHKWSALARRLGFSAKTATQIQRRLNFVKFPSTWADITTVVASRP